jgi:hypothetical protein
VRKVASQTTREDSHDRPVLYSEKDQNGRNPTKDQLKLKLKIALYNTYHDELGKHKILDFGYGLGTEPKLPNQGCGLRKHENAKELLVSSAFSIHLPPDTQCKSPLLPIKPTPV